MANSVCFDLICEILVRLPTKSLIRFKSVCKPWNSLISSSDFIKSHKKHSFETTTNVSLVFFPYRECRENYWIHRTPLLNPTLGEKLYLPESLIKTDPLIIRLVGSCNGFVCIEAPAFLALINPLTRTIKRVPFYDRCVGDLCYGFGYDSRADDYKLVGVRHGCVVVYSLRKQSWNYIPFCGIKCLITPNDRETSVFLNGRLHWLSGDHRLILSFDLHQEDCHKIQIPNHEKSDFGRQLSVLDGYLCVTYRMWTASQAQVWGMKEYGVEESWAMLFSLPSPRLTPLLIIKQEHQHEVLLTNECDSNLYNIGRTKMSLCVWNAEENTLREISGPKMNYPQVAVCLDCLLDHLDPLVHGDSFTLDSEDDRNGTKWFRKMYNDFMLMGNS